MGNRGDSIADPVPNVGDAETAASGDVTDILTELVARSAQKVTPAEIDVDATLDINTQSVDNINDAEFINRGSAPGSTTNRFYKANDEWYLDAIQVTKDSGTSLNVAASAGAIGGDYGDGDEVVNYSTLSDAYEFLSDASPNKLYSQMDVGPLQIFEKDVASSESVLLGVVGGLAASYSLGLFAELPASNNRIVTIGSGGILAHGPGTLPASESFLTIDSVGDLDTADNATPYANFKHADIVKCLPLAQAVYTGGGSTPSVGFASRLGIDGAVNQQFEISLTPRVGDILRRFDFTLVNYAGSGNIDINLYEDGVLLDNVAMSANGSHSLVIADETVAADQHYTIQFDFGASVTDGLIESGTVTYRRG